VSRRLRFTTLASIVLALALLIPGVTQPVLTLTGTMDKAELVELGIDLIGGENAGPSSRQMIDGLSRMFGLDSVQGELEAYAITRSIWGAVVELGRNGNLLVATLIMTFSIVVPAFKLLMQLAYIALPDGTMRIALEWVVSVVAKWSMADVFVMSLIIVFLAGRAQGDMGDLLTMGSNLEVGFYWFLGFCLFSIASSQLLEWLRQSEAKPA
jgi:hypothetical protein